MDLPSSFSLCPNVITKLSHWLSSTTKWKSMQTLLVNIIVFLNLKIFIIEALWPLGLMIRSVCPQAHAYTPFIQTDRHTHTYMLLVRFQDLSCHLKGEMELWPFSKMKVFFGDSQKRPDFPKPVVDKPVAEQGSKMKVKGCAEWVLKKQMFL